MKKILNGPTIWRAKCPCCDCEFEYDYSEVDRYLSSASDSHYGFYLGVQCPACKRVLCHKENPKSPTEVKKEDTMTI